MLKYYINRQEDRLLVDGNEHTPYLAQKGYEEITRAEYKSKVAAHSTKARENDINIRRKKN